MLITVRFYDWQAASAYSPPLKSLVINTDHVVTAHPRRCDRVGDCIRVVLIDGRKLDCEGDLDQFLE